MGTVTSFPSGSELLSNPAFRELFLTEAMDAGEELSVKRSTPGRPPARDHRRTAEGIRRRYPRAFSSRGALTVVVRHSAELSR